MTVPYRPDRVIAVLTWVKAALSGITGLALVRVSQSTETTARRMEAPDSFMRGSPAMDPSHIRTTTAQIEGMASVLKGVFALFAIVMLGVALIEIAIGRGIWRGRRRAFRWGIGLEVPLILLSLLFFSLPSLLGIALSLTIVVASIRRLRGTGPAPIEGRVVLPVETREPRGLP